jgi:uncharacterized protein (TIGR02246 family)
MTFAPVAGRTGMTSTEDEIRALIERWAAAVRGCELEALLEAHADDIVMFDVPPPQDGIRGLAAYRASWPQFFEFLRRGGSFDILELDVTAGEDVAYAWALLRCGTEKRRTERPDERLRVTVGLRREDGRWLVAHEHHSFVHEDGED